MSGSRGNPSREGEHLPWGPELQEKRAARAAPAAWNSSAGPSEVQQKGGWQEVESFIIFYFPSCGSVWTGLGTVTAAVPRSIREGEKDNPIKGKVVEFLTGIFRGFLFYFYNSGILELFFFFLQCC